MQLKGSGTIKKHQTKKYFHSLTDKRRSTSTRNILISNFKLDEYILNFLPINLKSFCRGVLNLQTALSIFAFFESLSDYLVQRKHDPFLWMFISDIGRLYSVKRCEESTPSVLTTAGFLNASVFHCIEAKNPQKFTFLHSVMFARLCRFSWLSSVLQVFQGCMKVN